MIVDDMRTSTGTRTTVLSGAGLDDLSRVIVNGGGESPRNLCW